MSNFWGNLINKINRLGRSLVLFLMLPLLLWGSGSSTARADIDPKLESQVLEIIRKNPQVILESVQVYQKSQQDQKSNAQKQSLKQIQAKPTAFIQGSPAKGATSQKLVLMEFSDFECPYCAKAHETVQQFMAKSQDRVTLVYKHFPLINIHPQAEPAALAAWAAQQQQKFWEFHDGLFENQKNLGDELYISLATKLTLNLEKFNSDRQSEAAKKAIKKDVELGMAIGVPGTPFFVMNGLPVRTSENLLADLEAAANTKS
jgi:protein-disulfide isomerase